LGLRCTLAALPGEAWCRRHHPNPPAAVMTQAEQARARLRRDELWRRPDGRVLDALYELTDSVDQLCATTREALDRAHRLEAATQKETSAWLDIDEAASYTRRTRAQVARAANNGELSGVRERPRSRWSFRPADLDKWLEASRYNSGRYAIPLTPTSRGRRRYE
jgi:excisionase family DNA binding protein